MRLALGAAYAALVLLLAHSAARADGCRKVITQAGHGGYVAPVVHAQKVVAHGYAHAHHDVVYQPYAIPVAVIPATLYQVAPELAYARVNQELADAAAEKAVRRALQELLAPTGPPPKEVLQSPADEPAGSPRGPGAPEAKGGGKVLDVVRGMVTSKCLKCHGQGSDFDLSDVTRLTRADRLEVVHRIMTDDPKLKMPRGPAAVTPDELNAFHAFVTQAPKGDLAQKK